MDVPCTDVKGILGGMRCTMCQSAQSSHSTAFSLRHQGQGASNSWSQHLKLDPVLSDDSICFCPLPSRGWKRSLGFTWGQRGPSVLEQNKQEGWWALMSPGTTRMGVPGPPHCIPPSLGHLLGGWLRGGARKPVCTVGGGSVTNPSPLPTGITQ